jgi:epoxyqueuosine reductase
MVQIPFGDIALWAQEEGLTLVGIASVDPLSDERERLARWQRSGFAGEMEFMNRSADIFTSPSHFLPSAQSVAVFTVKYDHRQVEAPVIGFGRVARYAWGRDYHKVLKRRLARLLLRVERECGSPIESRSFSDSVPLLERALARRAGGGFIGKNTMFITPGIGSFFFLSEILWNVSVVDIPTPAPLPKTTCGSCTRCLTSCPTGAFVDAFTLDAARCIAYLTIEKRTALTIEERIGVGHWVFGCDVCQEVCPYNFVSLKRGGRAQLQELEEGAGVGPYLDLAGVIALRSDNQFVARFGGTALMRTKREGLVRNAAIVAANTCAVSVLHDLIDAALHDRSALVRQHAIWAAHRLALLDGEIALKRVTSACDQLRNDVDMSVRDEVLLLQG